MSEERIGVSFSMMVRRERTSHHLPFVAVDVCLARRRDKRGEIFLPQGNEGAIRTLEGNSPHTVGVLREIRTSVFELYTLPK